MVTLKRPASSETLASATSRSPRRTKPTESTATATATATPLQVTNLNDRETVYQQCVLLVGRCLFSEDSTNDYIRVQVIDSLASLDNVQNWPVHKGNWKSLVLLAPGSNGLIISLHHAGGKIDEVKLSVNYQPLLQLPPLHLAIMVAKDSPLVIDCPPSKYGAFSLAHSSLDAAIAKFRTTAYMWQALTAEDMRQKGLRRRSFRLEEEWSVDTVTAPSCSAGQRNMRSTAKVHIIRCDKTVAELRNADYAQQNPCAQSPDFLHSVFSNSLKASGAPFDTQSRAVVAGMILDSHYDFEQGMILGHAALGSHNPNGISLGVFGSHLTYSWPRLFDEISACLTDSTPPGDLIGNDNGECNTNSQACFVGQGAFLHEVGHAFSAGHTAGIMARGYSKSWGHAILASSKYDDHEAKWDLQDCLRFKTMAHFRLPGEAPLSDSVLKAAVEIRASVDADGGEVLSISSLAKLATVRITNGEELMFSFDFRTGGTCSEICISDLDTYDSTSSLEIEALSLNGVATTVKHGWRLFDQLGYICIPGTNMRLNKLSIGSSNLECGADMEPHHYLQWTNLLRKRASHGKLVPASNIDLRIGALLDGAVVNYADGTHANCGPILDCAGEPHVFGGHLSENLDIPPTSRIVKVEVGKSDHGYLKGLQMYLDNGQAWGTTNGSDIVETLAPGPNEEIVGFFGTSETESGFTEEFGILTAPRGTVPECIYDMPEFQNFRPEDEDARLSQDTMEG